MVWARPTRAAREWNCVARTMVAGSPLPMMIPSAAVLAT